MLVLPWALALIVYALFCISFIYCKRYATKILKVKPPAPFSIPLANKNNIKLGGSSRVDLPHRYLSTGNDQPPSEPYVQVSPHTALPLQVSYLAFFCFMWRSLSAMSLYLPEWMLLWHVLHTGICFLLRDDIRLVNPEYFSPSFLICFTWCI